jgi:protein gp37
MSDLFHEGIPDDWIDRVFAVMALAPHHTFQVLTKRSARMRAYLERLTMNRLRDAVIAGDWPLTKHEADAWLDPIASEEHRALYRARLALLPLRNVWLGVSAEDQERADERIPDLLTTPAAVRFISAEPLLGAIDLASLRLHTVQPGLPPQHRYSALTGGTWDEPTGLLNWVICGGESGKGARPMHPDWARSLRDQCRAAGVPFFFKQWGAWHPADYVSSEEAESLELQNRYEHVEGQGFVLTGKKHAGRILDGREWSDMPAPPAI